ncbi:MFS transporter [Pseudolactococcus reticulitermitis]|uniref:Major facilitator superfamily (MFS) profile domain-containing protein n=1 Tax=Pseudolactococcus reticulitermitis TaxID=2025039 RepID=A0A224XBC8_9LACT|nr:MFS transporter [Lactococcus reticulitermitis]GAX46963.1 hypothetical protein RsY01_543 [Lactococcus reticulitermitis]
MSKNLKILFLSRIFSEFARAMYPVVLPLFILKLTNSLAISGLFFTCAMLPQMFLMPVIGVWIEKQSKKKVAMFSLLGLLILTALEFLILLLGFRPFIVIGMISALMSLLAVTVELATKVLFTEIVPKNQLEKYNGLKSVWDNIATFGAPMLSTVIYGFFGFKFVALLCAMMYLIASFVLSQMSYQVNSDKEVNDAVGFIGNFKEGLRFVKAHKGVRNFYLLASALNFFVANQEEVIFPGIVIQKYHISSQFFGLLLVIYTLGVILSGVYLAKKSESNSRHFLSKLFIVNSSVMVVMGLLSVVFQGQARFLFFSLFLALEFVIGFITILINVPMTSYFQSVVPVGYQGRVFALLSFISGFSVPLGVTYSGFLASKIGADWAYIMNNVCVILIVLVIFSRSDVNGD